MKAFLFDVDGVLTNSAEVSKDLVKSYFALKGKNIKTEEISPFLGKGMKALFLDTAQYLGVEVDLSEAFSFFRKEYLPLLKKKDPIPGSGEFVVDARKKGILVAVVSSAPKWRVDENLSFLGLKKEDFDLVVTEEDVKRNKPYPDIYRKAMIDLGVDESECVVFEDSLSGINAGKESGAFVVALATSFSREELKKTKADAVLDSFLLFPSYSSSSDLIFALRELQGKRREGVRYGANMIKPLERKSPFSLTLKEAKEKALSAMEHAYCPYSRFTVGASVLSAASGKIYSGCNVENASYGGTICAERNAITTAITAEGAIGIDLLVVASRSDPPAKPCAICLQVMSEFIQPSTPIVLINAMGEEETYKFSDLLPNPFDYEALQ